MGEIRNNFSIHYDPCNQDLNIYSRRGCIYADLHTHVQMWNDSSFITTSSMSFRRYSQFLPFSFLWVQIPRICFRNLYLNQIKCLLLWLCIEARSFCAGRSLNFLFIRGQPCLILQVVICSISRYIGIFLMVFAFWHFHSDNNIAYEKPSSPKHFS